MPDPFELTIDVTLAREAQTCRLVLGRRAHAKSPWVQLAYANDRIASVAVLRSVEAAVDARTGIDDAITTLLADGWTVAPTPFTQEELKNGHIRMVATAALESSRRSIASVAARQSSVPQPHAGLGRQAGIARRGADR